MRIFIMLIGLIAIFLGLFWLLQGMDIIQVCPILCFADCECVKGGSVAWGAIGFVTFIIGIAINYILFRKKISGNRS